MKAALCVAALLCSPALAQTSVVMHLASQHSHPRPSGKEWSEFNPGLAIRKPSGDLAYQGGVYRDSVAKWTVYALADYEPFRYEGLRFGGFVGAKYNGAAMPIAGFVGHYRNMGIRVAPAPKSGGVFVSLEFVF